MQVPIRMAHAPIRPSSLSVVPGTVRPCRAGWRKGAGSSSPAGSRQRHRPRGESGCCPESIRYGCDGSDGERRGSSRTGHSAARIAAIFKNEGPTSSNGSPFTASSGSSASLSPTTTATTARARCSPPWTGPASSDHLPFPSPSGQPPQLPAYAEILRWHGAEADWIAFIDADEFLLPAPPERSLRPTSRRSTGRWGGRDRGQLGGLRLRGPGRGRARPVIERFPARARQRPSSTSTTSRSSGRAPSPGSRDPDHFRLRPGFSRCMPTARAGPLRPPPRPEHADPLGRRFGSITRGESGEESSTASAAAAARSGTGRATRPFSPARPQRGGRPDGVLADLGHPRRGSASSRGCGRPAGPVLRRR